MALRQEEVLTLLGEAGHLRAADLHRAKLKGIDLSGQDLEGANLAGADLSGANLSGTNLKDADLSGAKLQKANLSQSQLHSANLTRAKFKGCTLSNAALNGANLARCRFTDVDLNHANLSEADLTEADFSRLTITGAHFKSANLLRAALDGATFEGCDFSAANLENGFLERTRLIRCDLSATQLKRANLVEAKLDGLQAPQAIFKEVDLAEATLLACDFSQVDLTNAILDQASFKDVNLDGALVKGADFQGVSGLSPEALEDLQARGAIVNAMAIGRLLSSLFAHKMVRVGALVATMGIGVAGFVYYLQPTQQPMDAVLSQAMDKRLADDAEGALDLYDSLLAQMEGESEERVQLQYLRAETLMELDRADEAAEIYQSLAQENAADPDEATNAKLQLASVHLDAGSYEAAIPILEAVADDLDTAPSDVARALINLSHAYERMGFEEKALSIAKRAQDKYTDHPDIALQVNRHICNIFIQRGDYTQAEALLAELEDYVHDDSERAELLMSRARLYEGMGDQEKALKVLSTLLKDYPDNPEVSPDVRFELANLLLEKGEINEAQRLLKALAEQDRLPGIRLHASIALARLHTQEGQGDVGLERINGLLEITDMAPEDLGATLMAKAHILADLGQADAALEIYNQVAGQSDLGQVGQALLDQADLLHQLERYSEEEQAFNQIQRQFAGVPDMVVAARMGMGRLMDAQGRHQEAIAIYEKALSDQLNNDTKSHLYHRLGQLHAAAGQSDKAREIYATMQGELKDSEAQAQALFGLAELEVQEKNTEAAIQLYRSVLKTVQDPNFWAQALQSIARLHEERQAWDEAALVYVEIFDEIPQGHDAHFQARLSLGHLYAQKKESATAHRYYQAASKESTHAQERFEAQLASANLYAADEALDEAEAIYQRLIDGESEAGATVDDAKMGLAHLQEQRGNHEAALKLYAGVAAESQTSQTVAVALRAQGALLQRMGRNDEALALQKHLLDRFGDEADSGFEAQLTKAQAQAQSGALSQAIDAYQSLLTTATAVEARLEIWDGLARAYQEQGDLESAAKTYASLISEAKGNPDFLNNAKMGLASVKAQSGDSAGANALYTEVSRQSQDPGLQAWALESQAQLAQQAGDVDRARAQYEKIIDRFSDAPDVTAGAHMGLAQLLRSEGDYDAARDRFKAVSEDATDRSQRAWATLYYAQTLIDEDEHEEALDILLDLMKDYDEEEEVVINARLSLADLYRNRERMEQAAKVYREVSRGQSFAEYRALALQGLAGAQVDLDQPEAAKATYDEILTRFAELPEATFNARLGLAKLQIMKGVDGAKAALEPLEGLIAGAEDPILRAWAKQALAQAYVAAGDPEAARTTYEALVDEASELPYLVEEAKQYIRGQ